MKLHQIFFVALLFFLPLQTGKHFWPEFSFVFGIRVDYLSPTIYLTDLLVGGVLVSWFWERALNAQNKNQFTIKKHWWVGVIFLYFLTNSLLAQNSGAALWKFAKIVELTLLGFYLAKNQFPIKLPIVLALIYSSSIAIAQFFKQASLGGVFWWLGERTLTTGTPGVALVEFAGKLWLRPYGTFSHPNSLAGFFLVGLVLVWGLGKNLPFWLKLTVSFLGLTTLILSFSRTVWLASLLLGLGFLVSHFWKKIKRERVFLPVVYFLLLLFVFGSLSPALKEKSFQERAQLVKVSWEMIKGNPFGGVGLNNFVVRLPGFWQIEEIRTLQPVHNIYFLLTAETGLVGLAIFFWFLFLTYQKLLKTNPPTSGLMTALTVILFTSLFDHYWLTLPQNQLLAAVVLGLSWGKPGE